MAVTPVSGTGSLGSSPSPATQLCGQNGPSPLN